jgi:ketosteroid isomerase-like protein
MDVREAANAWAATWRRAWPERDTDAVVALYAPDGIHRSAPFRDPYVGPEQVHDYFGPAFASEVEPATVWFGEPVVDGDRARVEWWAQVVADEGPATLAGCSCLRFNDSGQVVEQRDYWHEASGHIARPFDTP